MKKGIIYLCLSTIALMIIIVLSEKKRDIEITIPTPTTVQMLTEPVYSDQDERDYTVVIDAAGKERRLYLGDVDAKKKYDTFCYSNPTAEYSQVEKDHYYFMRSNGKGQYTIFRDKGEIIGKFKIKSGYVYSFIKYNSKFYLEWRNEPEEEDDEDRLAEVNLEEGNINFLADMEQLFGLEEYFYEDRFYICTGKHLKIYDLKRKCYEEEIETTEYFQRSSPNLIDGKFYYGACQGHKVKLFSFDPKTKKEEEILYFEHRDDLGEDGVYIGIDDENIYCIDYVIPRKGGKIYKESAKERSAWFYNNYFFYRDDNYKIHRVSKKSGKDRIITKMKAMDVAWTKRNVYIQAYEEDMMDYYDDDDDEPSFQTWDDTTSCDLYCMDLDGKNMVKIAD